MFSVFNRQLFRATPKSLLISFLIDLLWAVVIRPTSAYAIIIYIIFLPGFDLVTGVISFYNYVKEYGPQNKK